MLLNKINELVKIWSNNSNIYSSTISKKKQTQINTCVSAEHNIYSSVWFAASCSSGFSLSSIKKQTDSLDQLCSVCSLHETPLSEFTSELLPSRSHKHSRPSWSRMQLLFRVFLLALILQSCSAEAAAKECDLPPKLRQEVLHKVGTHRNICQVTTCWLIPLYSERRLQKYIW